MTEDTTTPESTPRENSDSPSAQVGSNDTQTTNQQNNSSPMEALSLSSDPTIIS